MKKRIFTTFSLLDCGAASAQSSVTLFGVIDAGIARISASGAHSIGLASGGSSTSRLGFRGTEDLGGGLAASFWLEGQLNNDTGSGATQTDAYDFARRSTVSLSGGFGEVRIGRDYVATYLNMNRFDTFGQRGIGGVENTGPSRGGVSGYSRASNSIAYFLPESLGGLYGSVQYAFGERVSPKAVIANAAGISSNATNATTTHTGDYYGGRVGYANGAFDVSASYGVFQDGVRTVRTSFFAEDYKIGNLGASYDFGFIKPRFLYQVERISGRGTIPDFKFETLAIGATAPVGSVGQLRVQVTRYNQANTSDDFIKYSLGYLHFLSKRTQLYADIARLNNKGASAVALSNMSSSVASPKPNAGGHSTGYIVGIRHAF
jgi:predicted porin